MGLRALQYEREMVCFDGVIESDLVHATCKVITFTLVACVQQRDEGAVC